MAAINITTWYGSDASLVENVLYENIFVESDSDYVFPVVDQKEASQAIVPQTGFVPYLLHVSVEKLGIIKGLGTQICEMVTDFSEFSICYRNLSFCNVQSENLNLKVDVCELEDILKIESISTENCSFSVQKRKISPEKLVF